MSVCDTCQSELSALMDHELERSEVPGVVDHLVQCADCRRFWRGARSVDRWAATLEETAVELPSAPSRVWERIVAELTRPTRPWGLLRPLLPLAAVLALAAGILWVRPEAASPERRVEVRLGERAGSMSEARFVELTTELLQADRRYHQAMLEIMTQVESEQAPAEGGEGTITEVVDPDEGWRRPRV